MLASFLQISDQDTRSTVTKRGGELFGQTAGTSDGRAFAYGFNGTGSGTALSPGKLVEGALAVTNSVNQTGITAAALTQTLTYTVGATAITANQYQDGYFYVNAGTGAGQLLRISGNTAATSTNSYSLTVNLHDAIITATSVSDSKFSLQPNPYSSLIISAHGSSTAIFAAGVPIISVPDQSYAWFQVTGAASVLANGTPGVGVSVIPSATTDGAVDVDGSTSLQPKVGYGLITAVTTEYRAIYLTINS